MTPSKTDAIQEKVFSAILHGEYTPGDRIPGEREMAELTGTSRITVRRAYARLEETGILERTRKLGTYISTTPRGNTADANHIALLTAVRDPFALEFICAMEKAVNREGALLVLRITEGDSRKEEAAALELVSNEVRNLVVWPHGKDFAYDTFARLRILGANMVFFDRILPGKFADYIGLDNFHALELLVKNALSKGKKEFLMISHKGLGADSDRQREEAFVELCTKQFLPHRLVRVPWGGDIPKTLQRNRKNWFTMPKRQAVICVNDEIALQVKTVIGDGRQVYGIDGLPEALAKRIPTVCQPMELMARKAVQLLSDQREKGAEWHAQEVFCKGKISTINK
ncbi:MAG: GntR family transcriptional regulator [Planctomycetes bacterium]|nr:GntR family transcriptional regulator [Planctomycetota bacterium]